MIEQSALYSFYDRDPAPIVAFIEYVRESNSLPRPGTVLDIGCGPGRLLAPLAATAWDVTGYEPDPDYAVAAARISEEVAGVSVRRAGFLDLEETETFDLIAAVNGPYSYVLKAQERQEAVRRCARALRPGGVLLLEFSDFPWILRHYREPEPLERHIDGTQIRRTARHDIDYHAGTFTHHDHFAWMNASGQAGEAVKTHAMALVSFAEVRYFLEQAGLDDIRTFNEYTDREPALLRARRVLLTARRGESSRWAS